MSSSPRVAMFLGAGASKAFGAPLTNEILPKIMGKIEDGTLFNGRSQPRQTLKELLIELMPGIEEIDQKHVTITEILSLIDYMLLSACVPAPKAKAKELHLCRALLERVILDLLPGIHRTECDITPEGFEGLGRWMFEVGNRSHFSLISTNYDEIVERELYQCFLRKEDTERRFDRVNQAVNFGLSWRDGENGVIFQPPANPRHAVLKLHGSVDWMKCELCGWIVCNDSFSLKNDPFYRICDDQHHPANKCHCGNSPLSPVMIAPSLVRDIRDVNILNVWKTACEELRTADHWFMIGYSLPVDDYAIRCMLIRALQGRQNAPRIHVYQGEEKNEEIHARYRAFFGDCGYYNTGMKGFIDDVVNQHMYVDSPVIRAQSDVGHPQVPPQEAISTTVDQ